MALNNLSSSLIQDTYEKLVQTEGGLLADGSGSAINSLTVTASFATVAATSLDATDTGSLMTTGSISGNTLTFTKGDASTFDIDLSGISVDTGSFMTTGSITDATITFTKGDSTTFSITVDTGSGGGGVTQGTFNSFTSSMVSFTSSIQTQVDNLEAVTGSFAITGSNTFDGNQTIDGLLVLTTQSVTPTFISGGLYLDSNYNLYIGGS